MAVDGACGDVVALALSGSSLAAPVGQISEFATPTPASQPEGMVAGPDGNLWFAELDASKIGEINPSTGAIAEFPTPTPNSEPIGITTGPDGNLWFTEFSADKIGEINPTTPRHHRVRRSPTARQLPGRDHHRGPTATSGSPRTPANKIGEINPTTHVITEFPVPTASSRPFGIAVGTGRQHLVHGEEREQDRGVQPRNGNVQRGVHDDGGGQPNASPLARTAPCGSPSRPTQ